MGGLRKSNEVLLAKIESSYGTDPTPAAASDAMFVRDITFAPEGLRLVDRNGIRASIGQLQKIYGGQLQAVGFQMEVKGSGAAGTAPEMGPLLRACGMAETIVASTSVTYKPRSTSHESVSMYYFEGGRNRHILTGCRGSVKLSADAGGILLADFRFIGHHAGPSVQSQPTPTYNAQVPRPVLGTAVSFNGVTAIVTKNWSIDLNNVLAMPPSMQASDGYGEVLITGRDVMGAMLKELELQSVIDLEALMKAGTRFAFDSAVIGSTAGNRVRVTTPSSSTYIINQESNDADGLKQRNVPFAVDDSTSDQEFSLIFT